jgi:hypothetical protein
MKPEPLPVKELTYRTAERQASPDELQLAIDRFGKVRRP